MNTLIVVRLWLLAQLMMPMSAKRRTVLRTVAFVPPTLTLSLSSLYQQHGDIDIGNASRIVNIPITTLSDSIPSFAGKSNSLQIEVANEQLPNNLQIEQLSPTTTVIVFLVGIIPFVWATYEFWRRIAVGASFGTGSDSVIIPSPFDEEDSDDVITIGEDNNPSSSRGRRTLDKGALTVAYVLFAVAGGSVAIALASVLMSPLPPHEL